MSGSSTVKTPFLSDSVYGALKHTTTIVLPAVAALYIALAQFWNFPKVEEVAGSVAAVNTFLGALLALSTKSYNNSTVVYDGALKIKESGRASIELHGPESEAANKKFVVFKVENEK